MTEKQFDTRSRRPGPTGIDPLTIERPSQSFTGISLPLDDRQASLLAKIYFATSQDSLSPDDYKVLTALATDLKGWVNDGFSVEITCICRTDPRGAEAYNLGLAGRRATGVESILTYLLRQVCNPKLVSNCKLSYRSQPESSAGRRAKADPYRWSEQRRVDVFATFETPWKKEYERNPWKQIRASIFKKYHPNFGTWRNLNLEYLVDEFERVEFSDDVIRIKEDDVKHVLELIARIDPDYYGLAKRVSQDREQLAKFYWVTHYHEWNYKVYPIFSDALSKFMKEHPGISSDEAARIVSSPNG